ncbi:MAG: Heavy metal transport/detoxification protein, partial [Parcubacteria group bacterium GW2011_GWD2_43_10]
WEIRGVNTYGCQSILQFPALNTTKYIKSGINVIEFTAQGEGQMPFHCAMGMYTGSFTVLPDKGS